MRIVSSPSGLAFLVVVFLAFPTEAQRNSLSVLNVTEDVVIPAVTLDVACGGMMAPIDGWHPFIQQDTTTHPDPPGNQVGTIPYSVTISERGQALVDIPIETFADPCEYAPNLTLSHCGGQRISYFGRGWVLRGIPMITRTNKDYFTDGRTSPVTLNSDDAFSLDGNRLILVDSIGDSVRVYKSQFGEVKVCYNLLHDTFVAYYPDGSKATFTTDWEQCRYLLSSMKHLDGRLITVEYASNAVSTISFGDGRSIEFVYESASPAATEYVAGHGLSLGKRVKVILVKRNGSQISGYSLGYSGPGAASPLSCVVRFTPDGHSLAPFVLDYNEGLHALNQSGDRYQMTRHFSQIDASSLITARGKFDYGSDDDGFLMYPNRDPYYGHNGQVFANKYQRTDSIIVAARYTQDSLVWCQSIATDDGFVEALAMDVDGVNGDEIVKIQNNLQHDTDRLLFTTYRFNGQSVAQTSQFSAVRPVLDYNGKHSLRPKSFLSGDFDGDGREELAIVYHANPIGVQLPAKVEFFDVGSLSLKGTFNLDSCYVIEPVKNPTQNDRIHYFKNNDRILATDLDGDGKQELAIMGKRFITYYRFTRNGYTMTMDTVRKELPFNQTYRENFATHVGDFNGDGVGDMMLTLAGSYTNGDGVGELVYLGRGDGTHVYASQTLWSINRSYICSVADINRDGVSDLVKTGMENDRNYVRVSCYKNGSPDYSEVHLIDNISMAIPAGTYANGAGNSTVIVIGSGGKLTVFRESLPGDVSITLNSLTDCMGNKHHFDYNRVHHLPANVINPGRFVFPYASYAEGMLVCDRHYLVSHGDTVKDERYCYVQPVVHRQGLGFCGFEQIIMNDLKTSRHLTSKFNPESFGILLSDSTELRSRQFVHNVSVSPQKRIKAMLTGRVEHDAATGVCISSALTHDIYGNVTSESLDYGGGLTRLIERQYVYKDSADVYFLGFENGLQETTTRGGLSYTKGKQTFYNTAWQPDSIVTWTGTTDAIISTEVREYDELNRVVSVDMRPYQGTVFHRSFQYRNENQVMSSMMDEKAMMTTHVYCGYGLLSSHLAPDPFSLEGEIGPIAPLNPNLPLGGAAGTNGGGGGTPIGDPEQQTVTYGTQLGTYYHYDTFGRQDTITAPDGSKKSFSWSWVDYLSPSTGYKILVTEDNKPTIRVWYDGLGRKVKQATQRFDESWAYTLYEYDHRGRLKRESFPSSTGTASGWTVYSYDHFDRMTQKQYPDGHIDSCRYEGLSTTQWIDGVWTTRTVDAMGNLVEVEDAGGTLQYTLRPDGQLSAILAPGGVSTTFGYDQYGRRVAINDPSAGTRTTTYDANGNVAAETDARGKSVTSTYNAKGLLTSRSFSDGITVTYKYNKWNLPDTLVGSDGHIKIWTYNSINQLATETVDGFTKTYAYDKNVPTSVAYSKANDYICSENYMRMNGHLTSITLNTGDTIWTLRKQNARLLPTKLGLGRLVQSLSYDVRGNVRERVVADRNNEELQWLECWYDAHTGNMTGREDWQNFTSEEFDYDGLNRLTDIEQYDYMSGYRNQSTGYDGKGNITSHHSAGQYGYGTAKPYAFNQLMSPSPLIPQREQHVSYNAMQQPDTIREGGYIATLSYYGDMTRAAMTVIDTVTHNVETRTYYDQQYNEFEKTVGNTTQTKRILWLGGTPYNAPAALVKRYGEQNWTLVHVLRDNLGSVTHVVDTTGVVLQEMSYTAWGLLRDPATLEPYAPDSQPELLLGRGYTGHEHLPWFGLVNMNARLYDPAVGRFLSPDPLVQASDNTQNYNRYSYCLNNPLRWTDESGKYFKGEDLIMKQKYLNDIQRQIDFYRRYISHLDNAKAIQQFTDKINELEQSKRDIEFLSKDKNYQYVFGYSGGNGGFTEPTGLNQYTMFTDGTLENIVHEIRHASQIAHGEFSFSLSLNVDGKMEFVRNGFNINHEVDAYKAQWAVRFSGLVLEIAPYGMVDETMFIRITSLSEITPDFVRSIIVDGTWLYKDL